MREFFKRNFVKVLVVVLALASFFTIYHQSRAGELFLASDTMSRLKIGVPANHEIAFRLTLATNVTENETITLAFSSGFDASLNGIDCGDVDLLDDAVQENLNDEVGGCTATATEWGATVAGGILTLIAPSNAGTYIAGSSDVIVKIGTNTTEEGVGNEQIVNPALPGNYILQIGGTFGDTKTVVLDIQPSEEVGVTATVGEEGGPVDRTPPVIFNLHIINITQTSATVTWETNEGATSQVNYGLTSFYGDSVYGVSFSTTHSVNLTGLSPDTLYHAQAVSADFFGNIAYSEDQTFRTLAGADTTPPIISNIQAINITQTSADITWQTNELADSKVDYGLTASYELGSIDSSALVASHLLSLAGLSPNTLYHFRVHSADAAANEAVSGDNTFTTLVSLDLTPPIISNIHVIHITETSAEVTWNTNELANSRVRYGRTTAYELGNILLTDFVTAHSVPLFSLSPNTLYHFLVSSTDTSSNTATSADQTFTTLPDLTPPANVTDFTATATPSRTIMLTWVNPTDPDFAGVLIRRSFTAYPTSPTSGELVFNGVATSFEDINFTPADYNRPVYYTNFAYDLSDNYSSGAVAQATIVVPVTLDIKAWPEKRWPRTGNWSTSAKVDLRELSVPTVLHETNVTTSSLGLVSKEIDAPIRNYDIGFKGESHLRKILRNAPLAAGTNSLDFTLGGTFYLLAGDTHPSQDNLVNSLDLSVLLNHLNSSNEVSDLNRDSQVNSLDINILLANLMEWGDK
jgi:hypothetical protein